jgi:transposase-like protein
MLNKIKENKQKSLDFVFCQDTEMKLELLKNQIQLSLLIVENILETEVKMLSGEKYSHEKPNAGKYSRWGYNAGSVRLGEEKVKIKVPRVIDNETKRNISLENYEQLKNLPLPTEELMHKVVLGISQRDYERVSKDCMESFGLSQSNVSRKFIEASSKALKEFQERDISNNDIIALLIDGKSLARQQIIIGLGITMEGEKIVLGFIQSTSENSRSIKQFLKSLIARGLDYSKGLYCVTDGSKGIKKALDEVFGKKYIHQRCQWHKRENIISYLNEEQQQEYRRRLQRAYSEPTYIEAKNELMKIREDLRQINLSAVNSLDEGFEETLTLHKLGLIEKLGFSLGTTNCIESLNSQLARYINKVKHWKTSDQIFRWVACGLMEAERRMKKIRNYKTLPKLREEIMKQLKIKINKNQLKAA